MTSRILFALVSLGALSSSCPAPVATACNVDDDCSRLQRCVLGTCVDGGEGEGASGEGEGAAGEGEGAAGEGEGAASEGEGGEGEGAEGEGAAGEGEGASSGEGEGEGPAGEGEGEGPAGEGEGSFPGFCGDGVVGPGEDCDNGSNQPGSGCEPGCTRSCYTGPGVSAELVDANGNCDAVFNAALDWHDALADCRLRGGNLATIEDGSEDSGVLAAVSPGFASGAWIGLNDVRVAHTLVWSDESTSSFAPFSPGEPSAVGQRIDCVQTQSGGWNDAECTQATGYVCEIPARVSLCGDGVVENGEQCDDGNTQSGDGCSATCTIEAGFTCVGPLCRVDVVHVPTDVASIADAVNTLNGVDGLIVLDTPGLTYPAPTVALTSSVAIAAVATSMVQAQSGHVFDVENGAHVSLFNLLITGATQDAVVCLDSTARIDVDSCDIGFNAPFGLHPKCPTVVRRSHIHDNATGGVRYENGSFLLENTLVDDNGSTNSPQPGVEMKTPPLPTSVVRHVTITQNVARNGATAAGIDCDTFKVPIESSIVFGNTGALDFHGPCAFVDSDFGGAAPSGFGNIDAEPLFASPVTRDFHLTQSSPCVDASVLSNARVDLDGKVRGGIRDIGAYEQN